MNAASVAMAALDEAIEVCGGTLAAFAEAISTEDLQVSASKVGMWRVRQSVPAEYAPAIYRETKKRGKPIECERFAPHVAWDAVRAQGAEHGA